MYAGMAFHHNSSKGQKTKASTTTTTTKTDFEQKTDKYMKQRSGLINFAVITDKTS